MTILIKSVFLLALILIVQAQRIQTISILGSTQSEKSVDTAQANMPTFSSAVSSSVSTTQNQQQNSATINTQVLPSTLTIDVSRWCLQTKPVLVSILQSNTNFYLTSSPYYVSFRQSPTEKPQSNQTLFMVTNPDCSISFKTQDGLFISLNPNYTYLMLHHQIGNYEKFNIIWKNSFFYIQSTSTKIHYWTIINGIGRPALKQASRFTFQIW